MEVSCKNNKHLYTLIRNKFNSEVNRCIFTLANISFAEPIGYNYNNNNNDNFFSRV